MHCLINIQYSIFNTQYSKQILQYNRFYCENIGCEMSDVNNYRYEKIQNKIGCFTCKLFIKNATKDINHYNFQEDSMQKLKEN